MLVAPLLLTTFVTAPGARPWQESHVGDDLPRIAVDVSERLPVVSAERLLADVEALVACGTRHFLSPTDSTTRGIGAARRFLRERLEEAAAASGGAMKVHETPFQESVGRRRPIEATFVNVCVQLEGTDPDRGAWVVGGHYDTINSDRMDGTRDAPGADDDASGTALVLELARLLATSEPRADVYLCAFDGEEHGLFGSRHLARQLQEQGETVEGMIAVDTVGSSTGPDGQRHAFVRCFSRGFDPDGYDSFGRRIGAETEGAARQLARFSALMGQRYVDGFEVRLVYRNDRFGRGGDHTAFLDHGFPGVRLTEAAEIYHHQHQDPRIEDGVQYGDLVEFLDGEYLASVARVTLATVMNGACAPPAPEWVALSGAVRHDTTVRWSAVEGDGLAGYRVWRRPTDVSTWTVPVDVPAAAGTETILENVSIDDWQFGVSSVDEEGYESPVRFPRARPRR